MTSKSLDFDFAAAASIGEEALARVAKLAAVVLEVANPSNDGPQSSNSGELASHIRGGNAGQSQGDAVVQPVESSALRLQAYRAISSDIDEAIEDLKCNVRLAEATAVERRSAEPGAADGLTGTLITQTLERRISLLKGAINNLEHCRATVWRFSTAEQLAYEQLSMTRDVTEPLVERYTGLAALARGVARTKDVPAAVDAMCQDMLADRRSPGPRPSDRRGANGLGVLARGLSTFRRRGQP